MNNHYTYYLLADDPFMQDLMDAGLPWMYIGVRTAPGTVDKDPYMGSSAYVHAAMAAGITFTKVVIRKHLTRKRANQDEKQLLETFKYEHGGELWDYLYNRVVPGEFGPNTRVGAVFKRIVQQRKGGWKVNHQRGNRKGGPPKGHKQSASHVQNTKTSLKAYWQDLNAFVAYHGIQSPGKGGANLDRQAFNSWRSGLVTLPRL